MNTSSSIGLSTLKPCGRILFNCKNSLIFGFPFPKFNHLITDNSSNLHSKLNHLHYYSHRIIGCTSVNNQNRRAFSESGSNSGQSRVFSGCPTNSSNDSFVSSIVANVASSDIRNHSISSVEVEVNENSFDKIYVGGGLDLKPFVIDTIEKAQDILANEEQVKEKEYSVDVNDSSSVNIDDFNKGLNGSRVLKLTPNTNREVSEVETEAWKFLRQAVVNYCGHPVGTVAAADPADKLPLNYDQVFVRDFVPSALAFLLNGEGEIVKNFLLHTLQLQSWEKTVDCHSPGQGLMPASFKVRTVPLDGRNGEFEDVSDPDFGESAIGRVAPVDSGLWWIILLRAYGKITGDYSLQERVEVQTGIKLILNLCLTDGFDMFPTLLVTDGSCMIDRRLGIHGHPLEIQSLFYSALRCSREMLTVNDSSKKLVAAINNRLSALSFHIREYYWVDMKKINEIYRYKTEEYSTEAVNKFNIYPDQIPSWLADWISETGGYFIGNLQPAHMDFRFFTLGNLWAIISSLGTATQNEGILDLIEEKWDDLVSRMPLKISYPALEYEEWRIITGSDPKNTPWSYHNGGSWPTLLWQFTLACIKMGKPELASKALALAEKRLPVDKWPEYYDTKHGRFIGKQSRLYQTWTIAGYLTSKMLLDNPEMASMLFWNEDYDVMENCVCGLNKTGRKCAGVAARSKSSV